MGHDARRIEAVHDRRLGTHVRDLILIAGGLFLLAKATWEIHNSLEGEMHDPKRRRAEARERRQRDRSDLDAGPRVLDRLGADGRRHGRAGKIQSAPIPVHHRSLAGDGADGAAVLIAVAVMVWFINPVSNFIERHPTVKMLALAFLLLIGVILVAEGLDQHIPRGYIYFAMGFSMFVEMLNLKATGKKSAAH